MTGKKDLEARVRAWLESEGYPLEMWAAWRFREAGAEVRQGEYFEDPDSGKAREIDILASIRTVLAEESGAAGLHVAFVVECKTGRPWLIMRGEKGREGPRNEKNTPGNEAGRNVLSNLDRIEGLPLGGMLRGPVTCGYGVTTSFKKKRTDPDPAYKACMSLGASISRKLDLDETMTDFRYGAGGSAPKPWIRLRCPIVIVEAPLFEAGLDEAGELDLRQISSGRVLWRGRTSSLSAIDIVSSDYLDEFLKVVGRELSIVEAACEKHPELVEEGTISMRRDVERVLSRMFPPGASGSEEE